MHNWTQHNSNIWFAFKHPNSHISSHKNIVIADISPHRPSKITGDLVSQRPSKIRSAPIQNELHQLQIEIWKLSLAPDMCGRATPLRGFASSTHSWTFRWDWNFFLLFLPCCLVLFLLYCLDLPFSIFLFCSHGGGVVSREDNKENSMESDSVWFEPFPDLHKSCIL